MVYAPCGHCQCGTQLHTLEFLLNIRIFVNKLNSVSCIVLVVLTLARSVWCVNKP